MQSLDLQTIVEGIFTFSPFLGFFQLLEVLAGFLNSLLGGFGLNFSAI